LIPWTHYAGCVSRQLEFWRDGEFRDLREGQRVEFELQVGDKGPVAVNVSAVA